MSKRRNRDEEEEDPPVVIQKTRQDKTMVLPRGSSSLDQYPEDVLSLLMKNLSVQDKASLKNTSKKQQERVDRTGTGGSRKRSVEEGGEWYTVQSVVGHRYTRRKKGKKSTTKQLQFKIHWRGYDDETWVNNQDLTEDCWPLVTLYFLSQGIRPIPMDHTGIGGGKNKRGREDEVENRLNNLFDTSSIRRKLAQPSRKRVQQENGDEKQDSITKKPRVVHPKSRYQKGKKTAIVFLPPSQQPSMRSQTEPIEEEEEDQGSVNDYYQSDDEKGVDRQLPLVEDVDEEEEEEEEDGVDYDDEEEDPDIDEEEDYDPRLFEPNLEPKEEEEKYDRGYAIEEDHILRSNRDRHLARTGEEEEELVEQPISEDEEDQTRRRLSQRSIVPRTAFEVGKEEEEEEEESDGKDSDESSTDEEETWAERLQRNGQSKEERRYTRWAKQWPKRSAKWAERDRIIDENRAKRRERLLRPESSSSSLLKLPTDPLAIIMSHLSEKDALSTLGTGTRLYDNNQVIERGVRLQSLIRASQQWDIYSDPSLYKYENEQSIKKRLRKSIQQMSYDLPNETPSKNNIPPHLTYLSFHPRFNLPIPKGVLPTTLRRLDFGGDRFCQYNQAFQPGVLPSSLKELEISGGPYNQPFVVGSLPSSLEELFIRSSYDQPIGEGVLPPHLTMLIISGGSFNSPLPTLPSSLVELRLPEIYNQPISPGVMSGCAMTTLRLPRDFNQKLQANSLPSKLGMITFGDEYNQPIPPGVMSGCPIKSLSLPMEFNQELQENSLPYSLESLFLSNRYNQPLRAKVLPLTLTLFSMGEDFIQPLEKDVLPDSITKLLLSDRWNDFIQVGVLPKHLQFLSFGPRYNTPLIVGAIPDTVTIIYFRGDGLFNHPIMPGVFPRSLTYLTLSTCYDEPIEAGVLPEGLIELQFGHLFNQELKPGSLPSTLQKLSMKYRYTQVFQPGVFPDSLSSLHLPSGYRYKAFKKGVFHDSFIGKTIYYGNEKRTVQQFQTGEFIAIHPPMLYTGTQGKGKSH